MRVYRIFADDAKISNAILPHALQNVLDKSTHYWYNTVGFFLKTTKYKVSLIVPAKY